MIVDGSSRREYSLWVLRKITFWLTMPREGKKKPGYAGLFSCLLFRSVVLGDGRMFLKPGKVGISRSGRLVR